MALAWTLPQGAVTTVGGGSGVEQAFNFGATPPVGGGIGATPEAQQPTTNNSFRMPMIKMQGGWVPAATQRVTPQWINQRRAFLASQMANPDVGWIGERGLGGLQFALNNDIQQVAMARSRGTPDTRRGGRSYREMVGAPVGGPHLTRAAGGYARGGLISLYADGGRVRRPLAATNMEAAIAAQRQLEASGTRYDVGSGAWSGLGAGQTAESMNAAAAGGDFGATRLALDAWKRAGSPMDRIPPAVQAALNSGAVKTNVIGQHLLTNLQAQPGQSTNMLRTAQGEPINIAYDLDPISVAQERNAPWHRGYGDIIRGQTTDVPGAADLYKNWSAELYNASMSPEYADLFGPGANGIGGSMYEGNIISDDTPFSPGHFKRVALFGQNYGTEAENRLGGSVGRTVIRTNPRTGEITIEPTALFDFADQLLQRGAKPGEVVKFGDASYHAGSIIDAALNYKNMGITKPMTLGFIPGNRLAPAGLWDQYDTGEAAKTLSNKLWDSARSGEMSLQEMAAFNQEMAPVMSGGKSLSQWYENRQEGRDRLRAQPATGTPTYERYDPKGPVTRFIQGWERGLRGGDLRAYVRPTEPEWKQHPGLSEYFQPGRSNTAPADYVKTPQGIVANPNMMDHPLLGRVSQGRARDFDAWMVSKMGSEPGWRGGANLPWHNDPTAEAYAGNLSDRYNTFIADKGRPGGSRDYQLTPASLAAFYAGVDHPSAMRKGSRYAVPETGWGVTRRGANAAPTVRLPWGDGLYQFAGGGLVSGPGGEMDDMVPATIDGVAPARLSSNEFVLPADVVRSIGGGSTEKGAVTLYDMIRKFRGQRRPTAGLEPLLRRQVDGMIT